MDDNVALLEQGTADFALEMEVEEDLEQEIETFVRLKRLGKYKKAHAMFEQVLISHIAFFPVVAEYADLLLEEGKYGALSRFLDIQIECMETVFEEDEVELLRIMRSLALIRTNGALRAAVAQASRSWRFLQRIGTMVTRTHLPNDAQIHTFELYIQIIVFAMNTSSWVNHNEIECPWKTCVPKRGRSALVEWYMVLSENNDDWNASRVLLALLRVLPNLSSDDQKVLFDANCFGSYQPDHSASHSLSESQILTAFTVSLGRAYALMDLALQLRLRYPDGFQNGEGFADWYLSYNAALKYHSLASKLLSGLEAIEQVNMHRLKFQIQDARFNKFLLSGFQLQAELRYPPEIRTLMPHSDYGTKSMRIFSEWILPFILLIDTEDLPGGAEISNFTVDLTVLLDIQLHENEDLVGYIETCALLYAALPYTWEEWPSTQSTSDGTSSHPYQLNCEALAFQTMNVAIRPSLPMERTKYHRLIFDTSNSITRGGEKDSAWNRSSSSFRERLFDIPLYILFLQLFRRLSPMDPIRFPSLLSDCPIEGAAGVVKQMFEKDIMAIMSGIQQAPFLTNEILFSTAKADSSLSACISAVVKIYQNRREVCQSIKERWVHRREFDKDPSTLDPLETSLVFAEKDVLRHWYNHIVRCGFRCEKDGLIALKQMLHILTMLEETLPTRFSSLAQIDTSRNSGISALLSSTKLTHKLTISVLDNQLQRILQLKPLETQAIVGNIMSSTSTEHRGISGVTPSVIASADRRLNSDRETLKGEHRSKRLETINAQTEDGTMDASVNDPFVESTHALSQSNVPDRSRLPNFGPLPRSPRHLYAHEALAVDEFERHVLICRSCIFARQDFNGNYNRVCERGHALAVHLTRQIFSQKGHVFSQVQVDMQSGAIVIERVNLPERFTPTLALLGAVESGLTLFFDERENTRNPYSTGPPWYPGGQDRGAHFTETYPYSGRKDSAISHDSGYSSRVASVYSHDRHVQTSQWNPFSQSKDTHTSRSSTQEDTTTVSRSRGLLATLYGKPPSPHGHRDFSYLDSDGDGDGVGDGVGHLLMPRSLSASLLASSDPTIGRPANIVQRPRSC